MLLVIALSAGLRAQDPAKLEATLKIDPGDRQARGALLDYYFLNTRVDATTAIAARRRHILWLIKNTPWDELAGGPAATIDAGGHRLADPKGFKLASDAWWVQATKPDAHVATLVNAAYFYKLADNESSIELLEKALALEPKSKEIAARLGDEYALAILAITMINKNGLPMAADPPEYDNDVARRARQALNLSINPFVLAKAAYQIAFQGGVLTGLHKIEFDPQPLAEATVARAVSLAPKDADVVAYRDEVGKLKLATNAHE
jgi:tetratricopeptide (TPR) repeat protein